MIGKEEIILLNVIGRIKAAKKHYALYNIYLRLGLSKDIDSITNNLKDYNFIIINKPSGITEFQITDSGKAYLNNNLIDHENKNEYISVASNIEFLLRIVQV